MKKSYICISYNFSICTILLCHQQQILEGISVSNQLKYIAMGWPDSTELAKQLQKTFISSDKPGMIQIFLPFGSR